MPPEVLNFRGHLFFIADDYGFIEYTYLKKIEENLRFSQCLFLILKSKNIITFKNIILL